MVLTRVKRTEKPDYQKNTMKIIHQLVYSLFVGEDSYPYDVFTDYDNLFDSCNTNIHSSQMNSVEFVCADNGS